MPGSIFEQIYWLFLLGIPVACIARTVVFEEVFRELHEACVSRSNSGESLLQRKFFYLFTCDYCFSHYVSLFFVWLMNFKLLVNDWRGSFVAFFSLVFCANIYLNIYARLRVEVQQVKAETKKIEEETNIIEKQIRKEKAST